MPVRALVRSLPAHPPAPPARSEPLACALAAGLALLLPGAALANDSTAVMGAGGLVLTETADIAMEEEALYISTDEIRVDYRFRNLGDRDITTIVAFPLPPIDTGRFSFEPIAPQSEDPVNFVDFRVTVDGVPVTPQVEQKAIGPDGTDVSPLLRAVGAPVSLFEPDWWNRLVALPEAAKAKLIGRGLLEWEPEYQEVFTHWTMETNFWWEQTFPAGAVVAVSHSYRPVAGGSFFSTWDLDDPDRLAFWQSAYCLDGPTTAGLRRMLAAQPESHPLLMAYEVEYILTTGGNWAGPIGRFRLTVDKGSTDAIVSLCAPDIEKIGPTTFALERVDFWPSRDLAVAVFHPMEAPEW